MPKSKPTDETDQHQPVLLHEVLEVLAPGPGQSYLDLTAGYGGHADEILRATGSQNQAILVDRDEQAITALARRFDGGEITIVHSEFLSTLKQLVSENRHFDMILADLGVSSPHLTSAERGFSFSLPGPLDMRMDRRQAITASDIVNGAAEAELADILARYGEEPKARRIAQAIIAGRPVENTAQLSAIISSTAGWRGSRGKIHPATRSFQAIRIAVNDELGQLEQGLPLMVRLLKPGGRLAIISFHSLEDRLVKQFLSDRAGNTYDAELKLLSKKPITATQPEIVSNPRARSAKLRAAVKIKTNRKGKKENPHAYQG